MLVGWLSLVIGWVLQGLSLWAVLVAIGAPVVSDAAELSALVATTSLAVVAYRSLPIQVPLNLT